MNFWSHCFSQNMNQKLYGFLPCSVAQYRTGILTIFGSYFGRKDDFINSFWNLLTFNFYNLSSQKTVRVVWNKDQSIDFLNKIDLFIVMWGALEHTDTNRWLGRPRLTTYIYFPIDLSALSLQKPSLTFPACF